MSDKAVKIGVVGLSRGKQIVTSALGEKEIQLRAICDADANGANAFVSVIYQYCVATCRNGNTREC